MANLRRYGAFCRKITMLLVPLASCASVGCGTNRSSDRGSAGVTGLGAGGAGVAGSGSGGAQNAGVGGADPSEDSAASSVTVVPSLSAAKEFERLRTELGAVASLDATGFATQTRVPFSALGSYQPTSATGMDLVQKSAVALNEKELGTLASAGFVVSPRQKFPSFMYGYQTIYSQDLPLYVSADSILYAVHKSYDSILKSLEANDLTKSLQGLLNGMSAELEVAKLPGSLQAKLDVYLTTARSLLAGKLQAPNDAQNEQAVANFFKLATSAAGVSPVTVFGLRRDVDFSQFKPRGHYVGWPELEHYFRAMIWLGRIDLRLIDVREDGEQVFERGQLEAAVALRQLMTPPARAQWAQIDDVVTAFVGEHDDMTPPQIDALLTDLEVESVTDLAGISDTTLAQAVIDGGYGAQRIASQIAVNGSNLKTLPLARSFAFLGQRYVFDSHVFSNVVYDRVAHSGVPLRLMPSPLDVAYAALGNDQAGMLLDSELARYAYAPELRGMRIVSDEHGAEFWRENLYNLWLGALRTLSPNANVAKPADAGLPSVAGTDAWGRRLLNAQLASWSELRHDTLLYSKQSYTAGPSCEFPSAYVDPYPEFFSALIEFATKGQELSSGFAGAGPGVGSYFKKLAEVATTLRDMARDQLQGAPLSAAHLAFINRAVHIQQICGGAEASGWYTDLFYDSSTAVEMDPTIADVHTQPFDESGRDVGRVLHVGAGTPQLMVVTVDSCTGAQAYVGLVSSYYEHVSEGYERLTDADWAVKLRTSPPPAPSWLPSAYAY